MMFLEPQTVYSQSCQNIFQQVFCLDFLNQSFSESELFQTYWEIFAHSQIWSREHSQSLIFVLNFSPYLRKIDLWITDLMQTLFTEIVKN